MTARSAMMPFPARLKTELKLDPVMLGLVLGTILGSIGVVGQQTGGLWNDINSDLDSTAW